MKKVQMTILALALCVGLTGCAANGSMNRTGTGALTGAAVGAGLGAATSAISGGHAGWGALVGAGFGLVSGALAGSAKEDGGSSCPIQ